MNRNFKLTTLAFASILALTPLVGAQQAATTSPDQTTLAQAAAPQTQPGNTRPGSIQPGQMQGGQKVNATLTLIRKVDSLRVIGQTPRTALNRVQARQMEALLTPLKTAQTLTTERARSISASIDRVLTPAQRGALARAESQMGGGRMNGGRGGQQGRMQNGQMQGAQGQNGRQAGRPQGNGQMNGGQQGGQMRGGPVGMAPGSNPFLTGRGGQLLDTVLGQLNK